jgi:tetratricopeptide (TPR) repeat protein
MKTDRLEWMHQPRLRSFLVVVGTLILCSFDSGAVRAETAPADALRNKAAWQPPETADVHQRLMACWLAINGSPNGGEQLVSEYETLRQQTPTSDSLDHFITVLAAHSAAVDQFREEVLATRASYGNLEQRIDGLPSELQPSARLWLGRMLARQRLYDEALQLLLGLQPSDSIDPAGLLFYRAVCHYGLLQREPALADLKSLLSNLDALPDRYRRMGQLMQADLGKLEAESLNEISRLMSDVGRRLELGRTGKRVQREEQEVIDKLKKLIDKLEEQQQQQQQQQQSQGGGNAQGGPSSQGMADSQRADDRGPGDVDPKDLGREGEWGNLPPQERQATLQALGRELPTHYGEAIEAYFRKLAKPAE